MFSNSQTPGMSPQFPNFGGNNPMMNSGMNPFQTAQNQTQMNPRPNYMQQYGSHMNNASGVNQSMNRSMTPNTSSMMQGRTNQSYDRPQPVRVENPYPQQQQMYGMNQQPAMQQYPFQMPSNPSMQYNSHPQQQQQYHQQQPTYRMN